MMFTAIYPDNSKFPITIDELTEYVKDEPVEWKELFWASVSDRGFAFGPIAKYVLNK